MQCAHCKTLYGTDMDAMYKEMRHPLDDPFLSNVTNTKGYVALDGLSQLRDRMIARTWCLPSLTCRMHAQRSVSFVKTSGKAAMFRVAINMAASSAMDELGAAPFGQVVCLHLRARVYHNVLGLARVLCLCACIWRCVP
jgi:hypothetical protein